MYSYVIRTSLLYTRMSLVCTCISFVCRLHVLVCRLHVHELDYKFLQGYLKPRLNKLPKKKKKKTLKLLVDDSHVFLP